LLRERDPQQAVYLDYAATTPVDPQVIKVMTGYLGKDGTFGNAASQSHHFGQKARQAVEIAREQVARLINADPAEIVWTSGATESVNLALKGVANGDTARGNHIVTSSMEHKAVLDSCDYLNRKGFETTYVPPDREGLISPERVEEALRDDTVLVSLMHVNNEVGTITDIVSISEVTRSRGIAFHVDAAQSAGRLPLDMDLCKADLVSLSGHKMYGPKGVGALYVRRRPCIRLEAQIHGGGHEQGLRSGTLATHQLVGMGEAARLVCENRGRENTAVAELDRRFLDRLANIEHVFFNGNEIHRVAGIANVSFACVDSESLMMSAKSVAFSSGSACTSARVEPSHVLDTLGLSEEEALCSVRFSFGRFTTEKEIDFAADHIQNSVNTLRRLSSEWYGFSRSRNAGRTSAHKPLVAVI